MPVLASAVLAATTDAASAMRSPMWAGAERIVLKCARDLPCAAVLAAARRDAPMPIDAADPAGVPGRRGTLILKIYLEQGATGPQLQPQIAPSLVIDDAQGVFTPRPTAFPAADDTARDTAIAAALDSVLPWRTSSRTAQSKKRFVIHRVQ